MATLLLALGWLFIASAICVLAYPFLAPVVSFDLFINGLPAGILVALGAQLLSQGKNMKDTSEKRSLFYLESCVKAYEEASKILQDGNNDRVKWIGAGRALRHAKELATRVTEDMNLRVLELHKLNTATYFMNPLLRKQPLSSMEQKILQSLQMMRQSDRRPQKSVAEELLLLHSRNFRINRSMRCGRLRNGPTIIKIRWVVGSLKKRKENLLFYFLAYMIFLNTKSVFIQHLESSLQGEQIMLANNRLVRTPEAARHVS